MRRKLSTAIHQTFNKYGITFVGKYHQDQPFIAAFQQTCKYVNLNQSKFGKSTKMENTLPFALGSIVKMGCIFQMRISNQDGNGKDIQIKTLQQIGIDICKAIDLTTAPQLIKEFPKFQQQMDISDSESCHSFDENTQNKKRIIKRKLTTINTGNENNLSIATTTTTKKSFLPSKLKPLGDISQYNSFYFIDCTKHQIKSQSNHPNLKLESDLFQQELLISIQKIDQHLLLIYKRYYLTFKYKINNRIIQY